VIFTPSLISQLHRLCLWNWHQSLKDTCPDIDERVDKFWFNILKSKICFEHGYETAENERFLLPHRFVNCDGCAYGIDRETLLIVALIWVKVATSFGGILQFKV
jgi:hypothetical protein